MKFKLMIKLLGKGTRAKTGMANSSIILWIFDMAAVFWHHVDMNAVGPFLTLTEAARYCGYRPRRFHDLVNEYSIPRKGPSRNRFAQSDLDAFMSSPVTFLVPGQNKGRSHKKVM